MIYKHVVIYDSECLMCNQFIQFIYVNDKLGEIYFSNFNSEFSKKNNITSKSNSIVFVINDIQYLQSDAIIAVLQHIQYNKVIIIIFKLFPKDLRNFIYSVIAKNRYLLSKFFRKEICSIDINSKIIK